MSLFVPPRVARELQQRTSEREAEAFKGLTAEVGWKWVEEFNRDLERIEDGMRLLWCPDPAPIDAVAMGAKPGRWGILIPSKNGGPASVKPLEGPNGEFVEPGAWVFDKLREGDWWNPAVNRERERRQTEAKRAAEKRREIEREEFNQECLERYLAVSRTQVSMNRSIPWSQNAAGRKHRRK